MRSFESIGEFVEYLRVVAAMAELRVQRGLHEAGRVVQEEARHSIGVYQGAAGPFPAWEQLADNTLAGYTETNGRHHPGKEELGYAPPDNPLERTGELKHAIELSVRHNRAVIGVPDDHVGDGSPGDPFRNLGDVAFWMELGTVKMPARSFLGRALFVKEHEVVSIIGHTAAAAVSGHDYHPPRAPESEIPF